MKSCGLSLTALAARPIWRTARPVSSAARLMLGRRGAAEVVGCRHDLAPWVSWSMAPPSALRRWVVVRMSLAHGRHAGARLLQRFQRVARVVGQRGQRSQGGASRFCRVASSRWVSQCLTLPAAWPMLAQRLGDALLVLAAQQLVDAAGGFPTWARMLGVCSAMRPKGEGLSVRRGRPLGPGATGAGLGGVVQQHVGQARDTLVAQRGKGGGADRASWLTAMRMSTLPDPADQNPMRCTCPRPRPRSARRPGAAAR